MKINEVYKFPLKYDDYGQKIFDQDNVLVVEVRGWGHIQYLGKNPEQLQDEIGQFICDAINEKGIK